MRIADCDRMRACVSLELDGELSPFETAVLERHLRGCPGCATFAAGVRACTDLLRAAPLEPTPALVLPQRHRASLRLPTRVAAAASAAAAAALVAVTTLSQPPPSTGRSLDLGYSPLRLVLRQSPDENLGVQRMVTIHSGAAPRRGALSL